MIDTLALVKAALVERRRSCPGYFIPGAWTSAFDRAPATVEVDPYAFYLQRIEQIELMHTALRDPQAAPREWSRSAMTYNLFTRLAAAWDHNGDGRIDPAATTGGWRETGTFLKSIALLPHIKRLGCNTIHLLPAAAIGVVGRKGTLGSPYAIKHPCSVDEQLAEPALGLGAQVEFKAFVEAAHQLGMRVVIECIMRTAAIDADWAAEHPEWFYWIPADVPDRLSDSPDDPGYGQPFFSLEAQQRVRTKLDDDDLTDLPAPVAAYRSLFTAAPAAETLSKDAQGRWIGRLRDGTQVRIPPAFADWPMTNDQPAWTDVTYLRLYDHPDFNYIAYNTVRMYDTRLARPDQRVWPLWQALAAIIPYYQREFKIDGAMIDMGHALPFDLKQLIVEQARRVDPGFAFWEENFAQLHGPQIKLADAVMRVPFVHDQPSLAWHLGELKRSEDPVLLIATAENHNTSRLAAYPGGAALSHAATAIAALLPCMPWIHNGFELGETQPVNPVFWNDPDRSSAHVDQCALFSAGSLDWNRPRSISAWITQLFTIRQAYQDLIVDGAPDSLHYHNHGAIWFVTRRSARHATTLMLIANLDGAQAAELVVAVPGSADCVRDLLADRTLSLHPDRALTLQLAPGGCVLLQIPAAGDSAAAVPPEAAL
jgi:starch synthase (maltosyl-transferring)